jgi:hypothetical protein
MLIALLALYLFAGSGTFPLVVELDHAKSLIKEEVAQGPHRAELLEVLDRGERTAKDALEKRKKSTRDLLTLVHRYDAQSADIQRMLEEQRAESASFQEQMIHYRFELKNRMSREEWTKLFPAAR